MSRLSRNIIYNLAGQGLIAVLGVVAVKYVFARLGGDAVGIIYFVVSLNSVLCGVLHLGISATILRQVSLHAQAEPQYVTILIRTASSFYWAGYIALAVLLYALSPLLVRGWIHLG